MASSTAPAAKRRILELLAARPALDGVTQSWSQPTEAEGMSDELVFLGDVALTGSWKILGTGRRDEDYTIGLHVDVRQAGDNMQATEERSWEILDEISGALTTDRMLSGLLMAPVEILSAAQRVGVADIDHTGSRIDAVLHLVARFTP